MPALYLMLSNIYYDQNYASMHNRLMLAQNIMELNVSACIYSYSLVTKL